MRVRVRVVGCWLGYPTPPGLYSASELRSAPWVLPDSSEPQDGRRTIVERFSIVRRSFQRPRSIVGPFLIVSRSFLAPRLLVVSWRPLRCGGATAALPKRCRLSAAGYPAQEQQRGGPAFPPDGGALDHRAAAACLRHVVARKGQRRVFGGAATCAEGHVRVETAIPCAPSTRAGLWR